MTIYELESQLRNKAEKLELNGVQTEIRELKNHVNALNEKIAHLNSANYRANQAIQSICTLLVDQEQFSDVQTSLYEIMREL